MLTETGLILLLMVTGLLLWIFSRFDRVVVDEKRDDGLVEGEADRIVTQVAAAQRLRREAAETTDPEERARLLRFADEADGTAANIRRGLLSDQ